ncbi:MAG: hypothetical protein K8R77_12570, partial [Anaerolineaceae bacterium]|nr:hypothetical protein [Anaerolineaceae bacterium]
MLRNKILLAVSLVIVVSMALTACQPTAAPEAVVETVVVEGEGEEVVVVVEGEAPAEEAAPAAEKVLKLSINQEFPTIDPSLAWDVS